jgi:transcriptional regulator with XRE-family HTH domain
MEPNREDAKRFAQTLGEAIKAHRTSLGLTLAEAAERTGGLVPYQRWSDYEHGTEPGTLALLAVCAALNTSVELLIPTKYRPMARGKAGVGVISRIISTARNLNP